MKHLIAACILFGLLLASVTAMAQYGGGTMYQTIPGTGVRDFSQPGLRFEPDSFGGGTTIRPTLRGTDIPDISQPGIRLERDSFGRTEMYETMPGTNIRNFSKPGYVFE